MLGKRVLPIAITLLIWNLGCDSSPTSFTGTGSSSTSIGGASLSGSFTTAAGSATLLARRSVSFTGMTVRVKEDPAITTDVSASGQFTLRGLGEQAFTLEFLQDGQPFAEIPFDTVLPNMEIEIWVEPTPSGGIRLVREQRTGIGHQELEIEGIVTSVTPGVHPKEGELVVDGITIVARPGTTAIREGNQDREMADVRVGDRVHVKGLGEGDSVLAYEIKIQRDDEETPDDDPTASECQPVVNGKITICHKPDGPNNTLSVSTSAWPAHKAHGDRCGPCTN